MGRASLFMLVMGIAPMLHAPRAAAQYAAVAELREHLGAGRDAEAVTAAQALLSRERLAAPLRNAVLELLARAHLHGGDEEAARGVLAGLYARDPGHRLTDPSATRAERAAFIRARERHPAQVEVDLLHSPPHLSSRQSPTIEVQIGGMANAVAQMWLFARQRGAGEYERIRMHLGAERASARIALPDDTQAELVLDYHVRALAPSGAVLARLGSEASPLSVVVPAAGVVATPPEAARAALASSSSPQPLTTSAPQDRDDGGSGLLGRWWFWAAVGVVVAGGVTAAFLLGPLSERAAPDGSLGNIQLLRGS